MKKNVMRTKEANRNFVLVCRKHYKALRDGVYGKLTSDDLEFMRKLYVLIDAFHGRFIKNPYEPAHLKKKKKRKD